MTTTAAFAEVDISCGVGVPLGGNVRADKASRGVHDPLLCTMLLVEADAGAWALVGIDLLATTPEVTSAIADAVAAATGIPAADVVVCASHTHSGPDVTHGMGFDQHDYTAVTRWLGELGPRVGAAAAAAWRERVPATAWLGRADQDEVAFNRRLRMRDGSVRMNWEALEPGDVLGPLGPVDPAVTTLSLRDERGAVLGTVLHYTLHPAILVGHEGLVSADWGAAARAERRAATTAPVVFVNGALGNVNHLDHRRRDRAQGFDVADAVGRRVGAAAVEAVRGAGETGGPVGLETITVQLDQRTVDHAALEAARAVLAAQGATPVDALDGIPPAAYACWVVRRGRHLPPVLDVEVRFVRVGALLLVGFPFEVFVEFQLELARHFPDQAVRVVSLVGDALGYLPTAAAFAQGGYEPTFGTSRIAAGQGERLFEVVTARLLARRHAAGGAA